MVEMKFIVVDLNNKDPEGRLWMKFATEEAANEWIKNYNDNSRRKRNLSVEILEKPIETPKTESK